ncbi:MAG: radical SAM protein [Chthoniobacterales bacterium]
MVANPTRVAIEATSVCQLRCPSCPTASGDTKRVLGRGFLDPAEFDKFLSENPPVREVELSNYGEAFLHPRLAQIFEIAANRKVSLTIVNGANLNTVRDGVLEALVKFRVALLSVSIDGASSETYGKYRVGGNYEAVLANIRRINELKKEYNSRFPLLRWQFIVFGHNEHEIPLARKLAADLRMNFALKLPWGNFSPIRNRNQVLAQLGTDFASRAEYEEKNGEEYLSDICHQLWDWPHINWDGKLLGCCRNFWGEFGPNVFKEGLSAAMNSDLIRRSRSMLEGHAPADDESPCATCSVYITRRTNKRWLGRHELARNAGNHAGDNCRPSL